MRTNVVINDDLMESALKISGIKTKREPIEEGLKLLIQMKNQEKIKRLRGKLKLPIPPKVKDTKIIVQNEARLAA